MADKCYIVVAECVDVRNGKRFFPGDTFDPAPDAKQADRLIRANCIEEDDGTVSADIETATLPVLKKIAEVEEVDLAGLTAKADILAQIKATRELNADGLTLTSDEGLAKIATDEKIDISAAKDRDAIVAAIREARAKAKQA